MTPEEFLRKAEEAIDEFDAGDDPYWVQCTSARKQVLLATLRSLYDEVVKPQTPPLDCGCRLCG